jgi:hypothetical protein
MNADLKAELIEVFTKQVSASIRHTFDRLVAQFGPELKGVYNSRHATVWSETVRPCCDRNSDRVDATYSLNEDRLSCFVAELSNDLADEVLAKVAAKVGELSDAEVRRVRGADFVITGAKNERSVRIEQNQIINVSSRGRYFNQYPSRIYVDGKFTPAAKFAQI